MAKELWQICEEECFEFLRRNYSNAKTSFELDGASDSTISDIKVYKNNIACFFIESKMNSAQCGQFVLLPGNDNHFVYSRRNKYEMTAEASYIIGKMDEDFDRFANAGTKGEDLGLDKNYYYSWIINFYKTCKHVKYFIIEKETGVKNYDPSNFVIFPIDKLHKYMDVSATYREKKSGSSSPSSAYFEEIKTSLALANIKYWDKPFIDDGKAYIVLPDVESKIKVKGEKYDYQFNPGTDGIFEIRKLSNTRNSNVIFSIWLKSDQIAKDLEVFKQELN